jgi:homogentisate 1,2-dioxygenase
MLSNFPHYEQKRLEDFLDKLHTHLHNSLDDNIQINDIYIYQNKVILNTNIDKRIIFEALKHFVPVDDFGRCYLYCAYDFIEIEPSETCDNNASSDCQIIF